MNQIRTPDAWKRKARALCDQPSKRKVFRSSRWVVAAVVACACVVTAVAAFAVPVLEQFYGSNTEYQQLALAVGDSVTSGGWTMTLTDVVADEKNFFVGFTLEAPSGTVLDAQNYRLYSISEEEIPLGGGVFYDPVQHDMTFLDIEAGGNYGVTMLPDTDKTDNQIQFLFYCYGATADTAESLLGQTVRFRFRGLAHSDWDDERQSWQNGIDCTETWEFRLTLDSSIQELHVQPNVPVMTLGAEATISDVRVTPVGVYVTITGDMLRGHHDRLGGCFPCTYEQKISLLMLDGTEIPVTPNGFGSKCSEESENPPEHPYLFFSRCYTDYSLVDLNQVKGVSVCGVEVPLQ